MKDACIIGIKKGMGLCINTLIPSTFPFLVMASFIVKSGLSEKMCKLFDKTTRLLFNLPGCCAPTIVLGLIGGYPAGARGTKALLDSNQISEKQAEQMLSFVVSAGPSFVITAIGCSLLKNETIGIVLFLAQIICAILTGVTTKFFFKEKANFENKPLNKIKSANTQITSCIVESVIDTTYSMINMCAFVIIFSCALAMINKSNIFYILKVILLNFNIPENICNCIIPIMLEVTSGCYFCVEEKVPIEFLAFTLGFAGICVHFQIFSILSKLNFSKLKFVIFRLFHGLLSAVATNIILKFIPIEKIVISNTNKNLILNNSSDYFGTILLILLCICFLISITKQKPENNSFLPLNK